MGSIFRISWIYYLVFVSRRLVRGEEKAFSPGETPSRCLDPKLAFSRQRQGAYKRPRSCEPFHLDVLNVSRVLSLFARGEILYFPKEFRSYIDAHTHKKKVSSNTRITPRFHKKKNWGKKKKKKKKK